MSRFRKHIQEVPETSLDPMAASLEFTINKFLYWDKRPQCITSVQYVFSPRIRMDEEKNTHFLQIMQ